MTAAGFHCPRTLMAFDGPEPRLGLWWLVIAVWAGLVVAQTPLSFRDALTMGERNQQLRAAEA